MDPRKIDTMPDLSIAKNSKFRGSADYKTWTTLEDFRLQKSNSSCHLNVLASTDNVQNSQLCGKTFKAHAAVDNLLLSFNVL